MPQCPPLRDPAPDSPSFGWASPTTPHSRSVGWAPPTTPSPGGQGPPNKTGGQCPPSKAHAALLLVLAAWVLAPAPARGEGPPRLTVVRKAVEQDQGGWLIQYRLRYDGPSGFVLTPDGVFARVEGWVSNSRVASHAVPRWSSVVLSGPSGPSAVAEVITAADESQRCRERAVLQVWPGDSTPPPPATTPAPANGTAPAPEPLPLLSVAPGDALTVRLRLEHQHFLYGDYDPLLGARSLELHLGPAALRDALPTDREQYLAQAKGGWPTPPEDRRDTRFFISAPDSLHLEAHVPGNQYYRFPERPVRYATRMRLKFWYLVAAGTEGEVRVRVSQFKDTPAAWKVLSDGTIEHTLTTVGRWVKVEKVFRTEPEATTLALDFKITDPDSHETGEVWIDDVTLEPVGEPRGGP